MENRQSLAHDRARRRFRALAVVSVTAFGGLTLSGCTQAVVDASAVAEHNALSQWRDEQSQQLVGEDLQAGLAMLHDYSSSGYMHGIASNGAEMHTQHDTTIVGTTYQTKETTAKPGETIDRIHVGGSGTTMYLMGDAYQQKIPTTPWVAIAENDLDPNDAIQVCEYGAQQYACWIVEAYTLTQFSTPDQPHMVKYQEDGSRQLVTAVTLKSLVDAGVFSFGGELAPLVTDATMAALIPVHIWLGADGDLQKAEINGTVHASDTDLTLEVQIGFEVSGDATEDDIQLSAAEVDPKFITQLPADQVQAFWDSVSDVRMDKK